MALPPVIQDIVRLIGHNETMALVREFGRDNLRIPKTEVGANWAALAEVIGEAATGKLCKALGGQEVYVACCDKALRDDRNRQMIARYEKLLADGHSGRGAVSVLVREYRICYRQVEKIVNSPTPEPSMVGVQVELF